MAKPSPLDPRLPASGAPGHGSNSANGLGCPADGGFTLVEVLATILVLVVGLFATVSLLDRGNEVTRATLVREGATNLARDVTQRARQTNYALLTTTAGASGLATAVNDAPTVATPASSTSGPFSWTSTRRGASFRVTVAACKIDTPSDGTGVIDSSFCAYKAALQNPLTTSSGGACPIGVNANLGVLLNLNGLLDANAGTSNAACLGAPLFASLCTALSSTPQFVNAIVGANGALDRLLNAATAGNLYVNVCPSSSSGLQVGFDNDPNDLTRITTTITPTTGSGPSIKQSTLVSNPAKIVGAGVFG